MQNKLIDGDKVLYIRSSKEEFKQPNWFYPGWLYSRSYETIKFPTVKFKTISSRLIGVMYATKFTE